MCFVEWAEVAVFFRCGSGFENCLGDGDVGGIGDFDVRGIGLDNRNLVAEGFDEKRIIADFGGGCLVGGIVRLFQKRHLKDLRRLGFVEGRAVNGFYDDAVLNFLDSCRDGAGQDCGVGYLGGLNDVIDPFGGNAAAGGIVNGNKVDIVFE